MSNVPPRVLNPARTTPRAGHSRQGGLAFAGPLEERERLKPVVPRRTLPAPEAAATGTRCNTSLHSGDTHAWPSAAHLDASPKLTAGSGAFFRLRRKHRARRRGCAANTSGAVTQSEQPHTGGCRKLSALLGAHTQGCPQGNRSSPTLENDALRRRRDGGTARDVLGRAITAAARREAW